MKEGNPIQILIICLGIPIGMYLSNRSNLLHQRLEHPLESVHMEMEHGLLDVSDESVIPKIVALEVLEDKMSGYNISFETEHFLFTPENVNTKHQAGQGHAHIYINGKKYARIYANQFHIPKLGTAIQEIRVTLNANNHETLSLDKQPIEKIWRRN